MSELFIDSIDPKKLYIDVKGHMKDEGLYSEEDEISIQSLAQCLAISNQAARDIAEHGTMFETLSDRGATTYKVNPATKVHSDIQGKIQKYFDDLGLTSKSRKGDTNGGDAKLELEKFLSGD